MRADAAVARARCGCSAAIPAPIVAVTRAIGLVPQQEALFERQRALEFVRLAGRSTASPIRTRSARAALGTVELDPDDRRRVAAYSKGMRQRVKLAQALVHDPHVLVLDEPLTGLDPRQRLHMIDLVQRLGDAGRCVVVSSHVLDEVERFGSRILVIAQGRLAAEGDFRAIRDLMDDRPRRFALHVSPAKDVAADLLFYGLAVGAFADRRRTTVVVDTTDAPRLRRAVAAIARNRQARLWELRPLDEDLESVFRYLVGARHEPDGRRAARRPLSASRPHAGRRSTGLFLGWVSGRARLVGARRAGPGGRRGRPGGGRPAPGRPPRDLGELRQHVRTLAARAGGRARWSPRPRWATRPRTAHSSTSGCAPSNAGSSPPPPTWRR